ncbi:MAG: type IV secretion system DNA-binding domain-containing protein [Limnobacter sp.]|uniref:type IV secretory system conjugative DNA transfer family protein n=1 Tax=Limnobacter sp. TaxID=2003368 RepID=UPI0022C56816|nr:DUF87 domain-containing protein [Limnobacter sp.]MCZ8017228.1 type IV secretion system DNA-binding domain-containing protein [Limnobacter sp.]MCZ8081542.1 type IV secretion system DNA-binding domain-containing protein [Paracoccaceae bacterium]
MSTYRIVRGAAAVSGAQATPVPELAAAHLKPGESLTLRYDLQPTAAADFTATMTLKTRIDPDGPSGNPLLEPGTAALPMLEMCLPGLRLKETETAIMANEVLLDPGYSQMLLAPRQDCVHAAGVEIQSSGQYSTPLFRLPALAPGLIRVDRLLEGLITSERASSLSVEIGRVSLGRREIKLIERARETLRAREMSLPADGSEASVVRFHLAYLQGWAVARAGVSLSFRIGFEAQPEPNLMKVAAYMLYGPRPEARLAPVDDRCPDLDFSLSVASTMKAPVLLLPTEQLDRLGFFSRRRWQGKADNTLACQIGSNLNDNSVALSPADLGRHLYIIGATGVGKSTLMARMIRQDIDKELPTIVLDPHGDLFNEIKDGLSDDQRQRACIADLSAPEGSFGLDLLDMSGNRSDIRLNFVCNQLIAVFRKVLYRDQPEGFGPMFESYFRNALMLLVLGSSTACSLSDFDRVFGDPKYRADLLAHCNDEMVVRFWKQTAVRAGGEAALENIAPYIVSKLTQFTGSPLIRPIIDGSRTNVNFARIFDDRGILLINLAKGFVGETDAALVGTLFTIELFATALARTSVRRQERTRVRLYMDEFQTYASDVLSQMLAECRKFRLELVLANQSLTQISGARSKPDIADAILANVGTVLAFRTGPCDARQLQDWFAPTFDASALMRLPDHCFAARLLQDGKPIEPFLVRGDRVEN